jgi:acetylornithine/N-succinyldiaminopimelate aminotransferase
MIELANLLTHHSGLDRVFFCNTGAEANEGSIKLARKWGQKYKNGAFQIITFENSFHGRTLATMSASGKAQWTTLFEPKVPGFIKVPFNRIEAVEAVISDNCVAIMLELVQGEGGVIPADPEFIDQLQQLAKDRSLLLIIDEVQTGVGRTGPLFCFQRYGIQPDIFTLGKGLGGGVPLAALVSAEAVAVFEPGDQGGTYNGNPLMTAVGVEVLKTVAATEFLESSHSMSIYLVQTLQTMSDRFGLSGTRGMGLLQALILNSDDASTIVSVALERGLLLNAPQPNIIRFMPSLVVSKEEIDMMQEILSKILAEIF